MAHPGGRPRIISSPEEFQSLADAYFDDCDANGKPYRYEQLGLACGLAGREGLDEYGRRPEYSDYVKRAKSRVRAGYEAEGMMARNPAMAIFILKNMGYSDRQDVNLSTPNGPLEVSGGIEIVLKKAASDTNTKG